jgi:FAD synthetase
MPTAAVIIIGDEILSGKFADENGPYFIKRLRELGVKLARLVVIADDLDVISTEVRHCSEAFDYVFTTGGVGPTHDDITLEGIALAFSVPLQRRQRLVDLLVRYGLDLDEPTLRMATVPAGSTLIETPDGHYPILRMENVYVFPGVPKLFRRKFEDISDRLASEKLHETRVYTDEDEPRIAGRLAEVAAAHPRVDIGSYPRYDEESFRVIVTLESGDPAALAAAEQAVREAIHVVDV